MPMFLLLGANCSLRFCVVPQRLLLNNNFRLLMVKTNRSTLHTVYIYTTYNRLSHRTAAITRFSPEGIGCQKQTAPGFANIRSGGPLPRKHLPDGAT